MSTELDLGWFDPQLAALQRPEAGGLSTGLSRAVAARLGLDVVLVRVVFVVLAFCGGLGLALYGWGTALTRGPRGTRPVDQILPGFRDWTPTMQKLAVIVSTVLLIGTIGAAFPLPWGAGLVILVVLILTQRRASRPGPTPGGTAPTTPGTSVSFLGGAADDQALVEQWRRSITEAVGTHRAAVPIPHSVPEVDLYGDDEPAPRLAAPRAKAGWWSGLAVLAAMAATPALLSGVAGASAAVSLAAATAVGGLGAIIFALVARRRRIPRPVLALVGVGVVATGWLATQTSKPAQPTSPETYAVRVVASDTVVDLRKVDLTGYREVRIEAIVSDVQVIVPAPPTTVTTTAWLSDVTDLTGDTTSDAAALGVELHIDARLSDVTLKEQP